MDKEQSQLSAVITRCGHKMSDLETSPARLVQVVCWEALTGSDSYSSYSGVPHWGLEASFLPDSHPRALILFLRAHWSVCVWGGRARGVRKGVFQSNGALTPSWF